MSLLFLCWFDCIFSDTISKTIQIGTTSIEESAANNFKFYPNPTTNQITIKAANQFLGLVYTVYDFTGKSVLNGQILSEQCVIELSNLSRAIYLLSIVGDLKQTFKLIKE